MNLEFKNNYLKFNKKEFEDQVQNISIRKNFINELSKIRPQSTFLTLNGYKNAQDEVANYSIIFHMNYANALRKAIDTIYSVVPETSLEMQAKKELLASYNKSLLKTLESDNEVLDDHYNYVKDDNGKVVKGIKSHVDTGVLYIFGTIVHKRIIQPGVYPMVNKRELTIAKDKLRKNLAVNKFRQFVIDPNHVESIVVDNLNLLPCF